MANLVICSKCGKWVHGICIKMKKVISTLANNFVCERCIEAMKGIVEPNEELSSYKQIDFVKSLCYLKDRLNASGVRDSKSKNWIKKI